MAFEISKIRYCCCGFLIHPFDLIIFNHRQNSEKARSEFQIESIRTTRNLSASIISTNTQTQYAHSTLQNCLGPKICRSYIYKIRKRIPSRLPHSIQQQAQMYWTILNGDKSCGKNAQ